MKVDIEKLREKISEFEEQECDRIDRVHKSDDAAVKAFTRAETRALKRREIINAFEELAKEFEVSEE